VAINLLPHHGGSTILMQFQHYTSPASTKPTLNLIAHSDIVLIPDTHTILNAATGVVEHHIPLAGVLRNSSRTHTCLSR
jgi:hypothetical protein